MELWPVLAFRIGGFLVVDRDFSMIFPPQAIAGSCYRDIFFAPALRVPFQFPEPVRERAWYGGYSDLQ